MIIPTIKHGYYMQSQKHINRIAGKADCCDGILSGLRWRITGKLLKRGEFLLSILFTKNTRSMQRLFICVALGLMAPLAHAYKDQKPGLMIFCASFAWEGGVQKAYVTPVYKISNKSYDQYWNWEDTVAYEQKFGWMLRPGTYGTDSTRGQYSRLLEEKKHLGRGECFATTSIELVKDWRRKTTATIVTNEWRNWKPVGYSAQVLEVIEFPHN